MKTPSQLVSAKCSNLISRHFAPWTLLITPKRIVANHPSFYRTEQVLGRGASVLKWIQSWANHICLPGTKANYVTFLVAQMVKCLPTVRETWVRSLGWEDPLEKEMATHCSILAWKIPRMEEPGRLQSTGLQKVGEDWASSLSLSRQTGTSWPPYQIQMALCASVHS